MTYISIGFIGIILLVMFLMSLLNNYATLTNIPMAESYIRWKENNKSN